jgi:hypothetical protein
MTVGVKKYLKPIHGMILQKGGTAHTKEAIYLWLFLYGMQKVLFTMGT